jgi:hypothetical protein
MHGPHCYFTLLDAPQKIYIFVWYGGFSDLFWALDGFCCAVFFRIYGHLIFPLSLASLPYISEMRFPLMLF